MQSINFWIFSLICGSYSCKFLDENAGFRIFFFRWWIWTSRVLNSTGSTWWNGEIAINVSCLSYSFERHTHLHKMVLSWNLTCDRRFGEQPLDRLLIHDLVLYEQNHHIFCVVQELIVTAAPAGTVWRSIGMIAWLTMGLDSSSMDKGKEYTESTIQSAQYNPPVKSRQSNERSLVWLTAKAMLTTNESTGLLSQRA